MNDDRRTALRHMLADAILLGTRLAQLDYGGPLQSEAASGVRTGIEDLRASTRAFLDSVSLQSLTDQDVFPLHEEIAGKLSMGRDACTREKK